MRSSTRTILAGALGVFVGFGTDFVSYLQGIQDKGGTFSEINSITVASIVLSSLISGAGALMLLLADPPEGKRLVNGPKKPASTLIDGKEYDVVDLGASK